MAQDAQLISQAGQVESLASDGLVSVSTGAGQPQKNMELAKFADSLGSSVPLQQTSEQVSITGLYARTSDGKMVELTKESVASVMAGLMDTNNLWGVPYHGKIGDNHPIQDFNDALKDGYYTSFGGFVSNFPEGADTNGTLVVCNRGYITQIYYAINKLVFFRTYVTSWSAWQRIDNFGFNSLAELSSGVAQQMGIYGSEMKGINITNTVYVLRIHTNLKGEVVGKYILKDESGNVTEKNFTKTVDSSNAFNLGFENGINEGSFVLVMYGGAY